MNHKLSIVILTFNSEQYLKEVLTSCTFANEVIIVDSGSCDQTLHIAQAFANVKIFHQTWLGFGLQKQKGVELASYDWIFVLDSDEIITEALKNEIVTILQNPMSQGYFVPRLNYFFGKPIKHIGLYPDITLRLFHREHGCFNNNNVHEKVILKGKSETITSPMIHHAYDNIEQFIDKQNRYSSLGAKRNLFKALVNPYWTFCKLYFLKKGFLEGWHGFIIAKLYAQYTFWKYIK